MHITNKEQLQNLLSHYGIWTNKQLGQHFLFDAEVCERMIQEAKLTKNDHVLEIGAGVGILTTHLAEHAGSVTTLELDKKTFKVLNDVTKDYDNITHLNKDCLDFVPQKTPYKIVANLPYQITGRIFRHFLEEVPRPTSMTVLIQKEVATKATRTEPKNNLLSLSIQVFGTAHVIQDVPPNVFLPMPRVHSSILHIDTTQEPSVKDPAKFFKLINICFKQARKTLRNGLRSGPFPTEQIDQALSTQNIDPSKRPQELSLSEWDRLAQNLYHA